MIDLSLLKQIHFMRPEWLLLLVPYFYILYKKLKEAQQKENLSKDIPKHLANALNVNKEGWKNQLPLKFLIIMIGIGIIISTGVSWKKIESPFGEDKSPLIVVMDVSESMLENDLQPTRLERSKQKITDLLEQRDGGKTSLVAYAGSAHTVMPLTEDIEVFKPLLSAVSPEIMPKKGKFAELAIPLIKEINKGVDAPSTILLVTDGLGSSTTKIFKESLKDSDMQLLVWGMGNPEKPSNVAFEEAKLKDLAANVKGVYLDVEIDDTDIKYILSRMESHMQLSLDSSLPWDDASYYLVFIMAIMFLAWFRKGWLVKWCFVGALSIGTLSPNTAMASEISFADIWLTKDQQASIAYHNNEFEKAGMLFENPLMKAQSYFENGDYKKAHAYFLRINTLEAKVMAANSLFKQREYVAARAFYKDLLKEYPENKMVDFNYKLIVALIEEINRFSESQANTEKDVSKELGDDDPVAAEGADENVSEEQMIKKQITADELLQDSDLADKWLQRVQSNPERFLRNKFKMQLNKGGK